MTLLEYTTKEVEERLFRRRADELTDEISELEDEAGLLRVEELETRRRSEGVQRELELVLHRLEGLEGDPEACAAERPLEGAGEP